MSLTTSGDDEAVPGFYDTGPPDAQGFIPFRFPAGRFNANFPFRARLEGEGRVLVRIETGLHAANAGGRLHGGYTLAAVEQALPVTLFMLPDRSFTPAVVLTFAIQFVTGGDIEQPIDVFVSVVRETKRLFFLSGTAEQGDAVLMNWQATASKVTPRK